MMARVTRPEKDNGIALIALGDIKHKITAEDYRVTMLRVDNDYKQALKRSVA